jgi:hypothetical protein
MAFDVGRRRVPGQDKGWQKGIFCDEKRAAGIAVSYRSIIV